MKIFSMLLCFAFVFTTSNSQVSTLIKGRGYAGYAFNKNHFVFMSIDNQRERYTPTEEEIMQVEKIVKDSLSSILRKYKYNSINQKTLKRYKRQYVGFVTNDGDIVIWINFLRSREFEKGNLSIDIIHIMDGGDDYWNIFINLTKNTFYGITINGTS